MRQPSFEEGVSGTFEFMMSDLWFSMPCVVVNVHNDFTDLRVDVQPVINKKYKLGVSVEEPSILNVPVQMPSSSTSAILFPVNKGDNVLCIFSQRGLDVFKSSNGLPSTPTDYRKFDMRDAIAIPGVSPFSKSPNNPAKHTFSHSTKDLTIVHNLGTGNECELRLKQDGGVVINTASSVTVNAGSAVVNADSTVNGNTTVNGALQVNGNITSTATISGNIVKQSSNNVTLGTHNHGGNPPVSGT